MTCLVSLPTTHAERREAAISQVSAHDGGIVRSEETEPAALTHVGSDLRERGAAGTVTKPVEAAGTTAISVVIPTFNRAHLIAETLRAVLTQTLPPAEVIVVDDGSTDDTAGVVASLGDRVRLLRIPNSGDLVARNAGLREASAPLVAFCDSDDLWAPEFLATMAGQWTAEPALLACYSNFRLLQDGALSARTKFDEAPDGFWDGLRPTPAGGVLDQPFVGRLLAFQPLFPSCAAVRRAAFLALGGWDEGVSRIVGCDFATALRIAMHPPVGIILSPLVAIRKHAGNFSGDTERMNLGDARVLEPVLRTRPELAPLQHAVHSSIARRRTDALNSAFSRRDFATVRQIYSLLPPASRAPKTWVKRTIASLPRPLGSVAASLLSR